MTQKFASTELARLYESQGYIEDALAMYKVLDEEGNQEVSEIRAAIHRLESLLAGTQPCASSAVETDIEKTIAELNGADDESGGKGRTVREEKISRLLDKWLMLMVVQKRVKLFKAIRARL